jgi:hypothetical protein
VLVLLVLVLLPLILPSLAKKQQQITNTCQIDETDDSGVCIPIPQHKCRLVVAPSTIPNAGLGIFTTVPLRKGELVGYGDLVIPIASILSSLPNPFEDYSWNGRVYGGELDSYAPGLQSLMNSNLALLNAHQVKPATNVFPNSVDSTPYHYLETITDHKVPVGGELFTVYGDHWFEGRKDKFKELPLAEDFLISEAIVANFSKLGGGGGGNFSKSGGGGGEEQSSFLWEPDLWELIKSFPFQSKIMKALPDFQDIEQVQQLGIRSLYSSESTRSLKELSSSQSRCLDMIRPGTSKVHQLGALATQFISKGTLVTGAPILTTSKTRWNAHGQIWDSFTQSYKTSSSGREEYALVMNYCWGHTSTSLLFCPYGIGVSYLNHGRKPNIKIQWAPCGEISHNCTTSTKTPKELAESVEVTLGMDFIALRDIKEGEELLVDYGSAWETSYQEHLRKAPKPKSSAAEWNTQTMLFTEAEQAVHPYPDNLEFGCHPNVMGAQLHFNQKDIWKSNTKRLECQVLERQVTDANQGYVTYAMRVFYENTWRGRAGIPREYVQLFEKKGPQQTPFRHPMQLPDHMVSDTWRDLK